MTQKKKIILQAETRGAKEAQKQFKGIGTSIKGVAAQYLALGVAIAGSLRFLKDSISKFQVQELAEKRLEVALGRTSKALLDQAAALQKSTSFADEEIIQGQALIAAFVDEEDAIKKATVATLDLAAAKGFDLRAAADLVSKTLGSSTNALTRYGIKVEGAVGSTERLESLTNNVAKAFSGQAAAAMETMSGRVENLSNSFGDMQEKIGETISVMDEAFGITSVLSGLFEEIGRQVEGYGTSIKNVLQFVGLMDEEEKEVTETLKDQTDAVNEAANAFNVWNQKRIEGIEKAQQEAEWLAIVNQAWLEQSDLLQGPVSEGLDRAKAATAGVVEAIGDIPEVSSNAQDGFNDMADDIINRNRALADSMAGVLENAMMSNQNFFLATVQGFKNMLSQMLAEMVAKAAIFQILNWVSGGTFGQSQGGFTSFLFGSRASGGPVNEGQPYVVGERGPEVFVPHGNGDIIPNEQVGNTVNITFAGNITDKRYVNDFLIPQIKTAVRQGIA